MELVLVHCPVCAEETEHQLLKASEHNVTVRCEECRDTRTMSPPRLRTVTLQVIVSEGPESWTAHLDAPSDETIGVGDEFEFEGHRMIVTGIDMPEGKATSGMARDVHVVHAKVFDKVSLKISVNEGEVTRSYELQVDPDRPVQIGEVLAVDDRLVAVKTMKSDQNRTLHKGVLAARNLVRVFCDPAPPHAVAGEVVLTRRRGAPKGSTQGPKSRIKAPRAAGPRRR